MFFVLDQVAVIWLAPRDIELHFSFENAMQRCFNRQQAQFLLHARIDRCYGLAQLI